MAKTLASPYGVNTFQVIVADREKHTGWVFLSPALIMMLRTRMQVPKVDTAQRYRRIRIKSCTPNSLGTHSIPLCALEVYGKLYPAPT